MTKKYTDREVGIILQRALEPAHDGDDPHGDGTGLTLEQIKEIAAEVGISGSRIERAAAGLLEPTAARANPFVGIPTTVQFQTTVEGMTVDSLNHPEFLTLIRNVLGRQGRTDSEFGSVEWRETGGVGSRYVSLIPTREGLRVRVMGNFRDALFASLPVGMIGGLLAGMFFEVSGLGTALPVVIPIGGVVAAAVLPPRFFYRWWRKREDSKLKALHEKILLWIGADAARSDADPDTEDPSVAIAPESSL